MDIFSCVKEIKDKFENLEVKESPLDIYRHLQLEMQELKEAEGDLDSAFELVDIACLSLRLIYALGFDAEDLTAKKLALVSDRLDMATRMKNAYLKSDPNKKIDGLSLYKKAKNKMAYDKD